MTLEVLKIIANGGFGRVELVRNRHGQHGARKVFSPLPELVNGTDLDKLKRRFAQEVKVQAGLPDRLFVPVLASDLDSDPPSFVMPLAERNLADAIEAGTWKSGEISEALSNILDSLEYLHARGIVHRDLKPQNVLYHEGRWKLSDFGLVLMPSTESTRLTTKLSAWGTQGYCAPEQMLSFRSVEPPADIYSLGCILHDIYARQSRVPFGQLTAPGPMGAVIEKCTEVDSARRFRNIGAVRSAVFGVLAAPSDRGSSPEAKDLAERVIRPFDMRDSDLADLLHLARDDAALEHGVAVFKALDENALAQLHLRDRGTWDAIAGRICEWAHLSFDWDYCDVIVGRLQKIFELGSPALKARAALAAADLGGGHNRYFVMGKVLEMCRPTQADDIAHRISVDILAHDAADDFIKCAQVLGNDPLKVYHRAIAAVLEEHMKKAKNDNDPFALF